MQHPGLVAFEPEAWLDLGGGAWRSHPALLELRSRSSQWVQELPLIKKFSDQPLQATLPIVLVGTIMGTMYFSFVCICMPSVGLGVHGATSVVFHSSFFLALGAYHQGIVTDPGRIPEEWRGEPDRVPMFALQGRGPYLPIERKKSGRFRYCHKEQIFKPDRAHYCSALCRNVLRMDHYCPWLSTCIGYFNHKYFIQFLGYTVIAINLADYHMIRALLSGGVSAGNTVLVLQGSMFSTLLAITLTPFFGFHCWLLSKNMTTLEYCEKRGSSDGFTSPYDRGFVRNMNCIMGNGLHRWLLPIGSLPGNGLEWGADRTEDDASQGAAAGVAETNLVKHRQALIAAFTELGHDALDWGVSTLRLGSLIRWANWGS